MAKNFFSKLFGGGQKQEENSDPAEEATVSEGEVAKGEPSNPVPTGDDAPFVADAIDQEADGQDTGATDYEEEKPVEDDIVPEEIAVEETREDIAPAAPNVEEPSAPEEITAKKPEKKKGFFSRLTEGLAKSSSRLSSGVATIFTKKKLDDDTLEELEELLITADLGVGVASRVVADLARDKFDKEVSDKDVREALASEVEKTLAPLARPLEINPSLKPHVILMVGVNGAGKTTTIGKLSQKFRDDGLSVMLAAGDTFRAAAIEQLSAWGERTGAPVISRDVGSDAAGLAYDALEQARADGIDVLMIDTAGRLQNKSALMDELAKIVRVLKKINPEAPHDTMLVLDATVGQNAVSQAQAFSEIAGVTGITMTKLDGTARGGVLVALADKFALPIHYIGVGESADDLQPFTAREFAKALAGADDE